MNVHELFSTAVSILKLAEEQEGRLGGDSPLLGYDTSTGHEIRGYRHGAKLAGAGSISYPSSKGYGTSSQSSERPLDLGKLGRLAVFGDAKDAELERRALSGAIASQGGVTLSEQTSALVIDLARAAMRTSEAGAITVPIAGDVKVARIDSDPVPQWRPENAPLPESQPVLSAVHLRPKTLGVWFPMSVELFEDAVNLGEVVQLCLAGALSRELDRVVLRGAGSAHEPLGILNTPGIGSTASVGAPASWAPFTAAMVGVMSQNLTPDAVITSPQVLGALDKLVDGADQPLKKTPLVEQLRFFSTTSVPGPSATGEAYFGDFSNVWIGLRQQIQIEFSRFAAGNSQSAFTQFQVWVRAVLRADVAVGRPGAFHVLTGIDVTG